MTDFERAMTVIGAVGVVAAIANRSPYHYNRYRYYNYAPRPAIVVEQPVPIIVDRPVIVETPVLVDRPVYIDRPVFVDNPAAAPDPAVPNLAAPNPVVLEQQGDDATPALTELRMELEDSFSPKLGAVVRLEYMELPGYCFMAARLMSDPLEGSPLHELGLQAGDVITRVGGVSVDSIEVLDQHERETEIRFIRSDTARVQLAQVYIPTDEELWGGDGPYLAP